MNKKYRIIVERTTSDYFVIDIEANDIESAKTKAVDEVKELRYTPAVSEKKDYRIFNINEI